MYIALNSTLTTGRVPWPEFARLAARLGYGGADVDLGRAMSAGADATKALLAELKIRPAVVGLPVDFRKDDDTFQRGLEKLPAQAEFAEAIGCPRMTTWIMPSTDQPAAELRALYLKRFRAVAEVLSRSHVRLGLEFIGPLHLRKMAPNEFIWRMPDMVAFATEIGPNVGVLLDSWHWHHAGGTPEDIIKAGQSRVVHVQLADSQAFAPELIRDNERLMPGEGVINWRGFFDGLKEIGYRDGASVEVFGRGLKQMPPEEGARLGLDTARAVFKKYNVS